MSDTLPRSDDLPPAPVPSIRSPTSRAAQSPLWATPLSSVCYLLQSSHPGRYLGRLYVGFTTRFSQRLLEHNSGRGGTGTKGKGPWRLVAYVDGFLSLRGHTAEHFAKIYESMWKEDRVFKREAASLLSRHAAGPSTTPLNRKLLLASCLNQHRCFCGLVLQLHTEPAAVLPPI
jgi:predicted GIY-YIG superfamily endonuclease